MKEVGIIGAGTMGHGIAQCFAVKGWRVRIYDQRPEALASVAARVEENLGVFEAAGLVDGSVRAAALANLAPAGSLAEAVASPSLVIETVSENLALKRRIFAQVEELASPEAVLGTNTSALSISLIAERLRQPERVVGVHFWNPPHVLPCVEVIKSRFTAQACFDRVVAIMAEIGKEPVKVLKDVPGFVGNRMQHALQREAMNLVDAGIASAEDVDKVVKHGFGLRLALMGPLERADLGGLDVTFQVQSYLLPHLRNETTPSQALTELVQAGRLGSKTGGGFYDWPPEKLSRTLAERDRKLLALLKLVASAG